MDIGSHAFLRPFSCPWEKPSLPLVPQAMWLEWADSTPEGVGSEWRGQNEIPHPEPSASLSASGETQTPQKPGPRPCAVLASLKCPHPVGTG